MQLAGKPRFISAIGLLSVGATGCSLGLDPALMTDSVATPDGSASAVSTPDGSVTPSAEASAAATSGSCNVDSDCAPLAHAGTCISGATCDPTYHVCMLDVCNRGACALSSCLTGTNPSTWTCDQATSMGFAISYFKVVGGGVGGFGQSTAIAAAYPFLFVLTTNGVVAYNVFNPTTNVPSTVPLHGMPFIPTVIAAAGRRVYFVAQVEGNGTPFRQAISWIDVPGDPFVASFDINTAWIETTEGSLDGAFARPTGDLVLVYGDDGEPVSVVSPPISDSMSLQPNAITALSANAGIVATNGDDLLAYRYSQSGSHPAFAVVSGVGQGTESASSEDLVTAFGPVADEASFASTGDGTVLWESPLIHGDAGIIASSRLTWLTPLMDGGVDTSAHVDLESYGSAEGLTSDVVGPVAWLDSETALALAANSSSPSNTTVQVLERDGGIVPGKRAVIPADPGSLGVAVSGGFAYVLVQDDPNNQTATVYVVATGCGEGATQTTSNDGGTNALDSGVTTNAGDGGTTSDASVIRDGSTGGVMPGTSFHQLAPN